MTTVLGRDRTTFSFSNDGADAVTVQPGTRVVFRTHDARAGAMLEMPIGQAFELSDRSPTGRSNPLTGPLVVVGAEPGDTLVVRIESILTDDVGWAGAKRSPILDAGRIPRALARSCPIEPAGIRFSEHILVEAHPMIGCIGTAPADGSSPSELPGRHGGNMDQKVIAAGAIVHLPVAHEGGHLFIGDVHAAQGDGELSGVGLEIGATVTVTVDVIKATRIEWPWAVVGDRLMVLTCGANFAQARRDAIQSMLDVMESQLGLEPAEAFGLLSIAGDLRIGQACGGMDLTLRLEVPTSWGLRPETSERR